MKLKIKWVFIIFILISLIMTLYQGKVYAKYLSWYDPTVNPDTYQPNYTVDKDAKDVVEKVLETINVIGVVSSVIILSIIGIKFILGSSSEKAEYKQTAMSYLLGAILIFGGTTLPNIIYKFGIGLQK